MKAICYISNIASHNNEKDLYDLITQVKTSNLAYNITGVLLIANGHFFQIIEGEKSNVNQLYENIKKDHRHNGVIKLLDKTLDIKIFKDYNGGEFGVFNGFSDLKKLYLYFNWIKNANYLPAEALMNLTTNFLKNNK